MGDVSSLLKSGIEEALFLGQIFNFVVFSCLFLLENQLK